MGQMHRREFMVTTPVLLAGAGCSTPAPPSPLPSPAPAATGAPRPWTDQPAYSIVRIEVRDGKAFGEYVAGHTPTIATAGGTFLVAGARPQSVEGNWPNRLMVIHQWPNARTFIDWYESAAYAPWKRLRHSASSAQVVLVQGVAGARVTGRRSATSCTAGPRRRPSASGTSRPSTGPGATCAGALPAPTWVWLRG